MDNLLPWATQHFAGRPFILQQDWAPSHVAKSTIAVLDAHFPGYLGKDLWPASSPDLNPMDFSVWGHLESKISGSSYSSVDTLKDALQKAWDDIEVITVKKRLSGKRERFRNVISLSAILYVSHRCFRKNLKFKKN
ncbi:hypothetical protein B9Z55_028135 [Caenorhabditis nigoni]|uniref:Tc1-like transposase DDE domain-containing protein n=1 Tax=Caenorhabditis nigoni TaxID=1611254 RepID=A0A2G5SDB0_9PELO|nr:hypothetical protein B9Z55_028135 [Caenorhabditis nigoni]